MPLATDIDTCTDGEQGRRTWPTGTGRVPAHDRHLKAFEQRSAPPNE